MGEGGGRFQSGWTKAILALAILGVIVVVLLTWNTEIVSPKPTAPAPGKSPSADPPRKSASSSSDPRDTARERPDRERTSR